MQQKRRDPLMQAGTMERLQVVREANFGYFLSNGEKDVLLHKNEAQGTPKIGDYIEVYLYHDHQNRLTATTKRPKLLLGDSGWLMVTDIQPRLGLFLDNGIAKELLLPSDELPDHRERWPKKGFELFVKVTHDRQGRLLARLGNEKDFLHVKPADASLHHKEVEGRVYKETRDGAFICTEDGILGLIHKDEMTAPLALGQRVRARVTHVRADGRVNLSMKPSKEVSYSIDAETILTYLRKRGGKMPYGDHTESEMIQALFNMSKSAFKRALGKLMKEGKIEQKEGWTYLNETGSP
jgi:predicted RNA-binding protein (virulence factor B family)